MLARFQCEWVHYGCGGAATCHSLFTLTPYRGFNRFVSSSKSICAFPECTVRVSAGGLVVCSLHALCSSLGCGLGHSTPCTFCTLWVQEFSCSMLPPSTLQGPGGKCATEGDSQSTCSVDRPFPGFQVRQKGIVHKIAFKANWVNPLLAGAIHSSIHSGKPNTCKRV